jgi:hypothetical protein
MLGVNQIDFVAFDHRFYAFAQTWRIKVGATQRISREQCAETISERPPSGEPNDFQALAVLPQLGNETVVCLGGC